MARLHGFQWKKGGLKEVVYVGADYRIHELYVGVGQSWQHADLTTKTGAAGDESSNIFGYEWTKGGTKQVVFGTGDGDIHELYVGEGEEWKHAILTQIATGAPPKLITTTGAGCSMRGYEWNEGGSKQVVYFSLGGIHELSVSQGGAWAHADLTKLSGFKASGRHADVTCPLAAYEWALGGTKQVVFQGTDNRIYEFYKTKNAQWKFADLTSITGFEPEFKPYQFLSGYQSVGEKKKHVAMAGAYSTVFDLEVPLGGSWSRYSPDSWAPHPESGLVGYEWTEGKTGQIVFKDIGGHIHELYHPNNSLSWEHVDLTKDTGAPPMELGQKILSAFDWEAGKTKQVIFGTDNGHIHELYVSGGRWFHSDLTERIKCPLANPW